RWLHPTLVPVINASGVILHTNLGRAPLSRAAAEAARSLSLGYSTLEYDLYKGKRGSRLIHAEALLTRLTGAEAALVVNNNAAAVLLVLSALARRQRVIISRTQLVEIGGGFRIPDVMAQSGARLVEIGTTNRVHLSDYQAALEEPAGMVLRAHQSNFRIIGFTSEPDLAEIVRVAHRHGVAVMDDLGSGTLLDTAHYGLQHEPTIQESLAAGVDVLTFSGDKLLGGPQAGIIIGRMDLLAKIKKHPLARAVRVDKTRLAALAATLLHYLKDEALQEIPVWRMISLPAELIQARAQRWADVLGRGEVVASRSTVGGGSLPEETLPTHVLALDVPQPNSFLAALRMLQPPIIARIEAERVMMDPRTVLPEEEGAFLRGIASVLETYHPKQR
ncbi:MAG TPA: L-seryl-tRNA(Sec) selenium transferase, partial [Anaerolineaceae bacterium]|nr:L-seryl-tRNA(Sec) selenium transferase [Anaerolineaceae bacterium]